MLVGKTLCFVGDGEGKTSAAIGHAIRAAGHGKKVAVIQFLKGRDAVGEYKYLSKSSGIEIYLAGSSEFVIGSTPKQIHIDKAKEGLALAKKLLSAENDFFLIVLDEILDAQAAGLLKIADIDGVIDDARTSGRHLILTGRVMPPELSKKLDLVTQMKKIKHYYDRGEKGMEGLDW